MRSKKNDIVKIENKIDKKIDNAKNAILNFDGDSTVDKSALYKAIKMLEEERDTIINIENKQNENIKKALDMFDSSLVFMYKLLEKDRITPRERKQYVHIIERRWRDVKELIEMDSKIKENDKKYHRDMFKKGVEVFSVGAILTIIGKGTVNIIRALRR